MGCLLNVGRIFLVVTNIIFFVIGLLLFIVGLLAKFGDDLFKKYYEDIINQLETSLTKAGYSNVNLDFNLSDLAGNLAIALIISGVFILIITICGFLGGCKKIKCILIVYAMILFILISAQILAMGLFYWKPDVIKTPIKDTLNSTIKSDYAGLNGTNVVSIGWNFVHQNFKCCGIENYYDFAEATNWVTDFSSGTLLTPLSCCVTLPSSADFSCAQSPLSTSTNNYNTGCFDEIWNIAIGNVAITASVIACCLIIQGYSSFCSIVFLLFTSQCLVSVTKQIIFFLTALCMYTDNSDKIKPKE